MRIAASLGVMIAALALAPPVSGGVTPAKGVPATRCPGAFWAHQYDVGDARTLWTIALEDKDKRDSWSPAPGSMGVHVIFKFTTMATRSLEFSVSYLPPGTRVMHSNRDEKSEPELQKSYTLVTEGAARVEGNLLVGPASAITRVRLISATFVDGSVWNAANDNVCSVEPNRVLPQDGKESSITW